MCLFVRSQNVGRTRKGEHVSLVSLCNMIIVYKLAWEFLCFSFSFSLQLEGPKSPKVPHQCTNRWQG